jgi:hypothetical protein
MPENRRPGAEETFPRLSRVYGDTHCEVNMTALLRSTASRLDSVSATRVALPSNCVYKLWSFRMRGLYDEWKVTCCMKRVELVSRSMLASAQFAFWSLLYVKMSNPTICPRVHVHGGRERERERDLLVSRTLPRSRE